MKAPGVLLYITGPRYRCGKHQCIQTRIIKPLSNILTNSDKHHRFPGRNRQHCCTQSLPFFGITPALQQKHMLSLIVKLLHKILCMALKLGYHQRCAFFSQTGRYIIHYELVSYFILNKHLINIMNFWGFWQTCKLRETRIKQVANTLHLCALTSRKFIANSPEQHQKLLVHPVISFRGCG